jgi:hypothetical protein
MLHILDDDHGPFGQAPADGFGGNILSRGALLHRLGNLSLPGKFQLSHKASSIPRDPDGCRTSIRMG